MKALKKILIYLVVTAFIIPGYSNAQNSGNAGQPRSRVIKQAPLPLDPNIRVGKLDNGFTYYIRKNTEPKNRAQLYLVNKTGSILENDNQRGLAHFMEHMSFNGTTHFPKNTLVATE